MSRNRLQNYIKNRRSKGGENSASASASASPDPSNISSELNDLLIQVSKKTYSANITNTDPDIIEIHNDDSEVHYIRVTEPTDKSTKYSIVILPNPEKLKSLNDIYIIKLNERIKDLQKKREQNPQAYNSSQNKNGKHKKLRKTSILALTENPEKKELDEAFNTLQMYYNKFNKKIKLSPILDQDIINAINIYHSTKDLPDKLSIKLGLIEYLDGKDEVKMTMQAFFKECSKIIKRSMFSIFSSKLDDVSTLEKLNNNFTKHMEIINIMKQKLNEFIMQNTELSIDVFIEFDKYLQQYKQSIIDYFTDVKDIFEENKGEIHQTNLNTQYIYNKYKLVGHYKNHIDKLNTTINVKILSGDDSPLLKILQIKNQDAH